MHAGILFSAMSAAVNLRGGDRMITGGALSGALGIFLCLLLGGLSGSRTTFEIWTIRCTLELELAVGVYRTKVSFSTFFWAAVHKNAGSDFLLIFWFRAAAVSWRFF
jgi:hypothetical protein